MKAARILTRALRPGILALVCGCAAFPAGAQSFKSVFDSGYDGWIADFADYATTDSTRRMLEHEIGPIQNINPEMTALRMSGRMSEAGATASSSDLFPFIRKRFTGLAPDTEYRIIIKAVLATAYGQFSKDTLCIKAGATTVEPRKTASTGGMYRINIDKGTPRRPGADMDTLGFIGYDGGGHRFPEARALGNAGHPLRFRSDGTGAVWICVGAEYFTRGGLETEFNIGTLQVELVPGPTSIRERIQLDWGGGPGLRPGVLRSEIRAWNLMGKRIRPE